MVRVEEFDRLAVAALLVEVDARDATAWYRSERLGPAIAKGAVARR